MKNRRSFLKMLGLGAVAAPVAARVAMEAPAVPEAISPGAINAAARQFMAMNAGHTHAYSMPNEGEYYSDFGTLRVIPNRVHGYGGPNS